MVTDTTRATGGTAHPSRSEFDEMVEQRNNDFFSRIIDGSLGRVLKSVDSGLVYGEAITQGERTVIPVSRVKVSYGFGGGSGYGVDDSDKGEAGGGSGGGGGGSMQAGAVGFIELTPTSTQFTPIIDRNPLLRIGAIVAGIVVVLLVGSSLRRG